MVAAMTPQGNALLNHLKNPQSETFFSDLVPLLDQFTLSVTDENVQQSLPLIQPLLELLSTQGDVPYAQVIMALSAILTPLPFEQLQQLGLGPMIEQGLQSKVPDLQILALQQVRKMSSIDEKTTSSLIECLGAEDASVATEAVDVIKNLFSSDQFQAKFLGLAQAPRTSVQIPRLFDLIVSLTKLDPQNFNKLQPLLNATLDNIRSTDVLMIMNIIQFYSHLLEASNDSSILAFLEPKIPHLMRTLEPEADAFQSLLGAGTCEFVTVLGKHSEFARLDRQYNILKLLEFHVLNPGSPQFSPALMSFSRIASIDGMFEYIGRTVLDAYLKMISTRPITPEKLTSLGIILSNNKPQESMLREQWFTLSLGDLVVPYIRDPTMMLSPITLLSALAGHVWGVKLIADSAVTMEWLQERLGDYQEATGKFAVVKRMLATTLAEEQRLGRHDHGPLGRWRHHIEIFVAQGEWWRDATAQVATEGA